MQAALEAVRAAGIIILTRDETGMAETRAETVVAAMRKQSQKTQ